MTLRFQNHSKKQQLWSSIMPDEEKSLDSVFFRFPLRADVVSAISSYLGAIPVLRNMDIFYSPPAKPSDAIRSSQLYHCDWDAESQIKVFVYASEVNLEMGPLTLIDAEMAGVNSRDLKAEKKQAMKS